MFQAKPKIVTYETLMKLCDLRISSNEIKKEIVDDNKDIVVKTRLSVPKVELVTQDPVLLRDENDVPELDLTGVIGSQTESIIQTDKRVIRVDNILKTPVISTKLKGSGRGRIKSFDPNDTLWV